MKSSLKTQIRIGKIIYTNCLPYYHQLFEQTNGSYDVLETYPAKLNQLMHQGKVDIAPISSLEYVNHQKNYQLLSDFVIGSRDFSGSVLLLSNERIENLNGAEIAVTKESLSSTALLKILLRFKYKYTNRFRVCESDPEKMLRQNKAVLVIGDTALFYQPSEFVYKYDLSELWWNWAEKPFCFAVWAVRREFAAKNSEEVVAFTKRLRKNLERNLADLEALIRDGLGMSFTDERFSKVFGYLFNLSYGIDHSMKEGLELFYRLANRYGLSPRPKQLDFFEKK